MAWRIPCANFARFWDIPDLVRRFSAHGATGAYLREKSRLPELALVVRCLPEKDQAACRARIEKPLAARR